MTYLFLAEVVAAQADDRVFINGRWQFDDDDLRTLHYFGGGSIFINQWIWVEGCPPVSQQLPFDLVVEQMGGLLVPGRFK